ncbi:hypothetical protein K3495_g12813 [Podosphaera aphanis]|nr:hypothetical protein K3495_g12813 [Podosphaera aphanis]
MRVPRGSDGPTLAIHGTGKEIRKDPSLGSPWRPDLCADVSDRAADEGGGMGMIDALLGAGAGAVSEVPFPPRPGRHRESDHVHEDAMAYLIKYIERTGREVCVNVFK